MLQAKARQSTLTHPSLGGANLIAGEEVQSSLGMSEGDDSNDGDADIVLLTNKRVIQISGAAARQRTAFVAIEDICAVELTRQPREGYGAYVWAGLAFFVSVMLWRIIENQMISIAAAAIVALMGVYLIFDRLTSREVHLLVFKVAGAEIQCMLKGDRDQSDAEALITRLFELKDERATPRYARAKTFTPR